jgi:hypothetical protein
MNTVASFLQGIGRSLGPIVGTVGILDSLFSDHVACNTMGVDDEMVKQLNCD